MVFALGLLAVAALGGLVYVFLSKSTSRPHKLAALVALILSGLALGICGIIIFSAAGIEEQENIYSFSPAEETSPPASKINIYELIIFLIVLVVAFGFIIYLGVKNRKKQMLKKADNGIKDSDFSPFDDL